MQPGDPFHDNMTIETCAYLCATVAPAPFTTVAALEAGAQCFCTNPEGVANATKNGLLAPASECNAPCAGNPYESCGGEWRLQAYSFSCSPYDPGAMPWQNASLPAAARVSDLVSRLSPVQLMAQLTQVGERRGAAVLGVLTRRHGGPRWIQVFAHKGIHPLPSQNGADVYAPGVQLPHYIVSQECLAGFDGGGIYLAPPIPTLK